MFVASPGDVAEERASVENIVKRINDILGETLHINLNIVSWENIPPTTNTPIYGKYTPMTFEDLLKLLDEYPDAFVMIDSKQYSVRNYQRTLEDYAQYREISIKAGIEHTLKQIIPEIYNSAMYPGTALLYKFPAYIYSLWQEYTTEELNDIAEFCQTNKIMAVTIYRDYWSEEVQKIFDERDILVYIYTINDKEEARRYLANGAQGVCTDVLITDNLN